MAHLSYERKEQNHNKVPKGNRQLSLVDKVSRLKNIGKEGRSYKKLRTEGINTVDDFLTKHSKDPQNLKNILRETMSLKKLEETINHAKTCKQIAGVGLDSVKEEMDSFSSEGKINDTSKMVCGIHKSVDAIDPFGQPFNKQVLESMADSFTEDEHLWRLLDTDMITRAFCGNEYQQYFDPIQSTMFCSPADLHGVLQELLVGDVPLQKAQSGWKLLISILRWLSVRRIVVRKHPIRVKK